jgi:ABC-type amino acid transport substrate-binding protein
MKATLDRKKERGMKKLVFLLVLIFLGIVLFHAKSTSLEKGFRIGVDPYFYSLNFHGQEKWISAYIEDLLLELSNKEGVDFERVDANWDTLLEDLGRNYDAVIASVRPYNFREEKYQFSPIFLATDPVLVLPIGASYSSLDKMKGLIVGVETGSSANLIVQKYPEIFMREYPSLAELLDALAVGQIDGAIATQVPAAAYLRDLYAGKLKMTEPLIEEDGLRFILLKGEKKGLFPILDKGIHYLKKKKLVELQRKWNLRT